MPNCCVVGCNNNLKSANVTLHNFPREAKEPERYRAWRNRINRSNFRPNHNHVVCSVHFVEEDFIGRYKKELMPGQKVVRRLTKTAVPSLKIVSDLIMNDTPGKIRPIAPKPSAIQIADAGPSHIELDAPLPSSTDTIGIQCELGSAIYYKYSVLYQNNVSVDGSSVHSEELSELLECVYDDTELLHEVHYAEDIPDRDVEMDYSEQDDTSTESQVILVQTNRQRDMERAACRKALAQITQGLPAVKLFLSDRHRGVGVLLRTTYPENIHELDVWHLAKSLVTRLSKAEKKSRLLSQWFRTITKHLRWSAETCAGNVRLKYVPKRIHLVTQGCIFDLFLQSLIIITQTEELLEALRTSQKRQRNGITKINMNRKITFGKLICYS